MLLSRLYLQTDSCRTLFSSALFAAEAYGVPVSVSWFAAAFIMSIILSVATPPIPGGALASISVLFAQLGLPSGGLAVVLALNIILDFIETPTDLFGGHAMLILTAKKLGLIDEETMRK
ncbi:MAG: cation:dicarboxylase symporter family transporter [Lachnospiraceae bacterium]|nr:cation:dicarboxylase symporter family transporter [Lachnospiraceae bacterium]